MRRSRLTLLLAVLVVVAAYSAFIFLSTPVEGYEYDEGGRLYDLGQVANHVAPPRGGEKKLRVLTWNIAYAYGAGSEAYSFEPRDEAAFTERLDRIAAKIKELDADVVLLQEVDFRSRRSHYQDQLAAIKRACGYPYAAAAVGWSARFVPYPGWPPSRQVGQIASGGGILSRYPLGAHQVVYHPQPAGNPFWYNSFYLRRYTQIAEIHAFGETFPVLNSHLEDTDAKALEASVETLVKRAAVAPVPLVIGGDFNAAPDDSALKMLRRVPQIEDAMLAKGIGDEDRAGRTFPSEGPTKRLDHLFIRRGVGVQDVKVIQAGDLSDHLPVLTTLVIGDS